MRTFVTLVCEMCGGKFKVKPYRKNTAKTCSVRCHNVKAGRAGGAIKIKLRGTGKKHRYVKELGRHQHRVVAEKKLGRQLLPWEVVHHIDGDGHNNDPENLSVITQSEHIKIHLPEMLSKRRHHGTKIAGLPN